MRFLIAILFLFSSISFTSIAGDLLGKKDDGDKKGSLSSPDFPGWLVLDIGFNGLIDNNEAMGLEFWPSKSFGIYHMKSFEVSKRLTFNAALGIAAEKFGFAENITLAYATDAISGEQNVIIDSLGFSPGLNKLAVTYLDLPLEFRYYPSKAKEAKGFFIGVGGAIGYRLSSHTKIRSTQNDRTVTTKVKDAFGLNNLRYGVSARVGYRGFSIYYKQYLSNVFQGGQEPAFTIEEPRSHVIGVSFALF